MDYSDKWAISLLGISSVLLLALVGMFGVNKFINHPEPQKIKVEWALTPTDSLTLKQGAFTPALLDSIQNVLTIHEMRINEKMEYIIEKSEQKEDTQTTVSIIIGFCISIFAFFGYKSFKDIKKEALTIAKSTSSEKAIELIEKKLPQEIDNKFRAVYDNTMRQTIQKEINDQIPLTLKNQIIEYLESLSIDGNSNEPDNNPEEIFE